MKMAIVVPPFGGVDRPALGPHVLQAAAELHGHEVKVFYGNIAFAVRVGFSRYSAICFGPSTELLGERLFAAHAHGLPSLGKSRARMARLLQVLRRDDVNTPTLVELEELEREAAAWLVSYSREVLSWNPDIVGCSTTFEQTNASLALLSRIREASFGSVTTVLGGANCDGRMANALKELCGVDYVFSGECEDALPRFLDDLAKGAPPAKGTIQGTPSKELDQLPTPSFADYYQQLEAAKDLIGFSAEQSWLPYESSRGCWWGEKSHCTFCGVNGQTMAYRQKSADRVVADLNTLCKVHPNRNVCMVDNIMPYTYFKTVLPALATTSEKLHIFYEQKANLTFEQVEILHNAGVRVVQPGIESLSTPTLKLMKKGTTARQNIATLRFCRIHNMSVNWNILFGFPGDDLEEYHKMAALLPLLVHTHPPTGVFRLSIDRFSPYHFDAQQYKIRSITPLQAYADVLPQGASVEDIAYHFTGDYDSGSLANDDVIEGLVSEVVVWRRRWQEGPIPALFVGEFGDDEFLVADTRHGPEDIQLAPLTREQAHLAIHGCRSVDAPSDYLQSLLEREIVVDLDGFVVPLATCSKQTFHNTRNNALHLEAGS
ncbi:MAG: RiPP maturation radical SAM protein 1 [Planctomycetes bacterium]|nr:RiPP maturation radical SAM protein 1 [Planctomycetota bacterium]